MHNMQNIFLSEDEITHDVAQEGRIVIKNHLLHLSNRPGVYRMLDANKKVLYVGKAKNLKKRVASYTRITGHPYRLKRMISLTRFLEFIETETEVDALLLETTLIKKLKPAYNILMQDDKSFPYILLTKTDFPRLMKYRGKKKDDVMYFGPFASALAVNQTIEILQKSFRLRTCSDIIFKNRTRPCLLYQLKKCSAPCTQEISQEEYNDNVIASRDFLRGKNADSLNSLRKKMHEASTAQLYEKAASYRDQINALHTIFSHKGFYPKKFPEADIFALVTKNGQACLQIFFFRSFQNWGNKSLFFQYEKDQQIQTYLYNYIAQFYNDNPCPKNVILSHEISERILLQEALNKKHKHKINILVPQKGEKKQLVDLALQNADSALIRHNMEKSKWQYQFNHFCETFNLQDPPRHIEIYDNSHIQGQFAVGAMVVADNEGFKKSMYRKYNMRMQIDKHGGDDYAMMQEVFQRRFGKIDAQHCMHPDVIIIDGGQGQLNAVHDILEKLDIKIKLVMAISKGVNRNAGEEKIHIKNLPTLNLSKNNVTLYFLQILRDESHRFAVHSHRVRRKKSLYDSSLDSLEGIGKKRQKALIEYFGSIKQAQQANIQELQNVRNISKKMAENLYAYWHNN